MNLRRVVVVCVALVGAGCVNQSIESDAGSGGGSGATGGGTGVTGGGTGVTGGGTAVTGGGTGVTGGGTGVTGGGTGVTGGGTGVTGGGTGVTGGGTGVTGGGTGDDGGVIDDGGTSDAGLVLIADVSLEDLRDAGAAPSAGSSWGVASSVDPLGGVNESLTYVKDSTTQPTTEKFEFYVPFTLGSIFNVPPSAWDAARAHLGEFTVADLASLTLHSRRNDATTPDFTLIVYTTPTGTDDDASWYHRRLHSEMSWAASLNAPANTWNTYTTSAGTNQLRFWDFRNSNVNAGEQPNSNYFTLSDMQAGVVVPTGTSLAGRDYRDDKIEFLSFSTYSNYTAFNGSIDGVELLLLDGRGLSIDLRR